MKFVCLGYIDETKFAEVSQEDGHRMMQECFAYDDELRRVFGQSHVHDTLGALGVAAHIVAGEHPLLTQLQVDILNIH